MAETVVLQAGEPDAWPVDPLAERLDRAYYALTRTTQRHFGEEHEGWELTGVVGLDAPTMNRAAVHQAGPHDVARVIDRAERFFGERGCTWSVVLSSFRDTTRWHAELVSRGMHVSTSLDVLAREPTPLAGPASDVRVREAKPSETPLFTDLLMEVFRMPRRFYPALLDMTDAWRQAGAKLYFGLDDEGEPASTTLLSFTNGVAAAATRASAASRGSEAQDAPVPGRVAGIYNVGTLRRERRRGHARALMARALDDARAGGAEVATLQVAPEGFVEQFYLDLGFSPVYHWRFYQPRSRVPFFGR